MKFLLKNINFSRMPVTLGISSWNYKIQLIKLVRSTLKCGLREAKAFIELEFTELGELTSSLKEGLSELRTYGFEFFPEFDMDIIAERMAENEHALCFLMLSAANDNEIRVAINIAAFIKSNNINIPTALPTGPLPSYATMLKAIVTYHLGKGNSTFLSALTASTSQ